MILIDAVEFDLKIGEILLPEKDAIPFRSQSIDGIGIQVTQERSPAFTLTLVRFTNPSLLVAERNTVRGKIGTEVSLTEYVNGSAIQYSLPGGHTFAVTQARIVNWNVSPAWYGYRPAGYTSFSPVLRMVSQWTMYAVSNP
ncbi:hypothetical protein Mal15_21940 [Stieleria maiorica]|uniref:Uncharacterized protein n=1 Tax=Stieleria maiorica TaxID=2795974 RepID=A0A5B9MD28_9BACT|nr:hypothetical protein [Stieleria maiorica]QEF98146.1 hypothetical protein Mal15_21940 [Stieleria maiorica]